MPTFSDLIRGRRRELRLSQERVAEGTRGQVSQPVLSAWETGALLPKADDARLAALAEALSSPLRDLETAIAMSESEKVNPFTLVASITLNDLDFLKQVAEGLGGKLSPSLMYELLRQRQTQSIDKEVS